VLLPALSSFFDAAAEDVRRRFAAHLTALDRLVRSGEEPSEAVLLGALLIHLPAPAEPGAPNARDRLLAELVATARLPRRIAERTRLALLAQRVLRGEGRRRRRRGLAGQAYFEDAVQLLAIMVEATGEGASDLERWRSGAPDEPASEAHEAPRKAHAEEGGPRPAAHADAPARAGAAAGEEQPQAPQGMAAGDADAPGRRRRRKRGGRRRHRRGGPREPGPGEAPQA